MTVLSIQNFEFSPDATLPPLEPDSPKNEEMVRTYSSASGVFHQMQNKRKISRGHETSKRARKETPAYRKSRSTAAITIPSVQKGQLIFSDSTYEGDIENGQMHGKGKLTLKMELFTKEILTRV